MHNQSNFASLDNLLGISKFLMLKVADPCAPFWKRLSRGLDLEESSVSQIDDMQGDIKEKCYQALHKWKSGEGKTPKAFKTLLDTLVNIGKGDIAKSISQEADREVLNYPQSRPGTPYYQ